MISDLVRQIAHSCGENTALAVWRLEEAVAAHRALVAAALELVSQRDREASVKDDRIQALREEIRRYVSAVVEAGPAMTASPLISNLIGLSLSLQKSSRPHKTPY